MKKGFVAVLVLFALQLVLSSLLIAGTCTYSRSPDMAIPNGRYEVTWVCTGDTSGDGPSACSNVSLASSSLNGVGVCEPLYGTILRVIIDPGTAPDASWDAELRMVVGGTPDTTVDLLNNLGDNISATNTQFIFPLTASGGIVQLFGDALIPFADNMGTDGDEVFTMRVLLDNSR
jgi:hypothetical protein